MLKNLVARTRPLDVNTAVLLLIEKPKDYPTDILGGIAVGIISGLIGYLVVTKLDKWKNAQDIA